METLALIKNHYIAPTWPAPKNIKAFSTTRHFGHSKAPFDSFNLSLRPNDEPAAVAANRNQLTQELELNTPLSWLKQVHGATAVCVDNFITTPEADAAFAFEANRVCIVSTADCLPLLVCNKTGTEVAAIHAGWRGLAAGVIEATLKKLHSRGEDLLVWLGPAIGPNTFEVGEEVRDQFLAHDPAAKLAFKSTAIPGKWLANIFLLAQQRLHQCDVQQIFGGNICTFTEKEHFYSYRRDKGVTGGMVSLIWRT